MSLDIITRAEAKAAGLRFYRTGKECKHGHSSERLTDNGACTECASKLSRSYARREYMARYRADHAEASREYHASWRIDNAAKLKEYHAGWRKDNPDAVARYRVNYCAANIDLIREKNRLWHKKSPVKSRTNVLNRIARKRAAEGRHTADEISDLLQKQKCKCAICRTSIKDGYHADHIIPLAGGGSNWISNIQLTCARCNQSKGAKDPITFMQSLGRLL
jgi:5-methylcytosine-specific restriction endonuclease McrA